MMTPAEFRQIRARANLSASKLAKLLRSADDRTIRRYEAGTVQIPGPVSLLMEMLDDGRLVPDAEPAEALAQ